MGRIGGDVRHRRKADLADRHFERLNWAESGSNQLTKTTSASVLKPSVTQLTDGTRILRHYKR
jgi:hypothetical protein